MSFMIGLCVYLACGLVVGSLAVTYDELENGVYLGTGFYTFLALVWPCTLGVLIVGFADYFLRGWLD